MLNGVTDRGEPTAASAGARIIPVPVPGRSYAISIGSGLIGDPAVWAAFAPAASAVIVTDSNVGPLWAPALCTALRSRFPAVHVVTVEAGERSKGWSTLGWLMDRMAALGCDRQSVVVALGGGVVGDLAGFGAACYMRGIRFLQVPTSLLAQIDSSIGGKTGINIDAGKNLVGAFHQPDGVVVDLDTLATLPRREYLSGYAEIVKHALVADTQYLAWLESHVDALLAREPSALAEAIARSCRIKAAVVADDEREADRRAILNLGHTFGHAIEAVAGYGAYLHGEAVSVGMVMAAELSASLGLLRRADVERVRALLGRFGLPIRVGGLGREALMAVFRTDKKAVAGVPRFVVLSGLGDARVRQVPETAVAAAVDTGLGPARAA